MMNRRAGRRDLLKNYLEIAPPSSLTLSSRVARATAQGAQMLGRRTAMLSTAARVLAPGACAEEVVPAAAVLGLSDAPPAFLKAA